MLSWLKRKYLHSAILSPAQLALHQVNLRSTTGITTLVLTAAGLASLTYIEATQAQDKRGSKPAAQIVEAKIATTDTTANQRETKLRNLEEELLKKLSSKGSNSSASPSLQPFAKTQPGSNADRAVDISTKVVSPSDRFSQRSHPHDKTSKPRMPRRAVTVPIKAERAPARPQKNSYAVPSRTNPAARLELNELESASVTKDNAPLRIGPGGRESILARVPSGSQVAIELRNGGWYRVISEDGIRGWITGSSLVFDTDIQHDSALRIAALRK